MMMINKNNSALSQKISKLGKLSKPYLLPLAYLTTGIALILLGSELALAAGDAGKGVGKIADTLTSSIGSFAKLIVAASYVAGISFALMGLLKFKAHKDQPQQVPLSQPIVLIAISAGLIFLPSIIGAAGESLGLEQRGSEKGEGLESK